MNKSILKARVLPAIGFCAALAAFPAAAAAQACLGSLAGPGQLALAGSVSFPESAKSYGAGATYNARGPLAAHAGFAVTVPDADGLKNVTSFAGGVAADLAELTAGLASGLSVCPNVSVGYSSYSQSLPGVGSFDLSVTQLPVGLAFGTSLPLGTGSTTLVPWVNPQFIYTRAAIKVDGESESDSDTFVGVSGGATVGFDRIFVGGTLSKIFEEGNKAIFGVQAGFVF